MGTIPNEPASSSSCASFFRMKESAKRELHTSDARATGNEAQGTMGGFAPSRLSLRANFHRARDV